MAVLRKMAPMFTDSSRNLLFFVMHCTELRNDFLEDTKVHKGAIYSV